MALSAFQSSPMNVFSSALRLQNIPATKQAPSKSISVAPEQ